MEFKRKTFSNGLRAIVAPMKDSQSFTLLALFGTGSKYETKNINGVSHFLEHLFFKGTKHRPKPGQVWRELNRVGAISNAFTSKEHTGYYVKAASPHFDIALDVVSDILLEPLFDPKEIEKERGVILQELSMYEDDPNRQAYEVFEELLYGNQPAGWDIGGTPDTVKGIKRNDILNYRKTHYLTSNAVVCVAGNVDTEETMQKIDKAFSKMKKGSKVGKLKVIERQSEVGIKFKKKDVDQTHIRLGARAYHMHDPRRYAATVLSTILGGNTSSRLFMELREKLGLTYYVASELEDYTDTGYLLTTAGVPHGQTRKAVKKIAEIFQSVKKKGVGVSEVKFAKEFIHGSMMLDFETSNKVAMFLASQEIFYEKIMTPAELLKKIELVSKDDIIKVARDIFRREKLNLAAISPEENTDSFKKILAEI